MQKNFRVTHIVLLLAIICLCFTACNKTGNTDNTENLWGNATYTENMELGNGTKSLFVEVKAGDNAVTFKINTDKETVGEALAEQGLIEGEKGAYGLYVKVVNGITADYNTNQSYWAFSKNGEYMQTGVDGEIFADGEHYELVYTK